MNGADPDALAHDLPPAMAKVLPEASVYYLQRMSDWVAQSFWQRTALSQVLSALALAAMALSAIGLFVSPLQPG